MKKLSAVFMVVGCFAMVGCMHTHTFDIQGHEVTQLRTWDLIGPSTVGFYESVDGKLHVYQDSSGNILGQVAQAAGGAYAGERIGDGIKHQEPDSTNITNELSSSSASEGGAALATGGAAISNSTSKGGSAVAGAISGSSSSAKSSSSSNAKATSQSKGGFVPPGQSRK